MVPDAISCVDVAAVASPLATASVMASDVLADDASAASRSARRLAEPAAAMAESSTSCRPQPPTQVVSDFCNYGLWRVRRGGKTDSMHRNM
jgi:hypothetical protein